MSEANILSLRDILHIFFKNKKIILTILITSILCSLTYSILTTKIYRAESDVLIKMGREKFSAINSMTGVNYNVVFQERTQNINNELKIITGTQLSKLVFPQLKALLERHHALEKKTFLKQLKTFSKAVIKNTKEIIRLPLYWLCLAKKITEDEALAYNLEKKFHAEYLEDTDIIHLTFSWSNPDFAAHALNIYTNEYLRYHTEVHNTEKALNLYSEQLDVHEQNLFKIEREIQCLCKKNNISNIEKQKTLLLSDISLLEKDLLDLSIRIISTENKMLYINTMMSSNEEWIETPNIGQLGEKVTDLATLDKIYFDLKTSKERIRNDFTDNSKEVQDVNRQITGIRKQKGESLVNILNTEINALLSQQSLIQPQISQKTKKLERLSFLKVQLEQLERSKTIAQDNFLLYSKKAEDLRIFNELDKSQILSLKIINPALPPLLPSHPKKWLILGISIFFALFFSFGLSILREYFSHGIRKQRDVEEYLNLPLLTTIPELEKLQHRS